MGSPFTFIHHEAFVGIANEGNCPKCANNPILSKKWTLYIKSNGATLRLKVSPQLQMHKMKQLIFNKQGISPILQKIIFRGAELCDGDTVSECKIEDQDTLHVMTQSRGIETQQMHYNNKTRKIIIGKEHGIFGKTIEISSFHVSCRSDKINNQDMVGVVLYSYNNKTDWTLNGVHCKSGYIILKSTDKIKDICIDSKKRNQGKVHGKCYKSIFGEEIAHNKVVGGGFSFVDNKWKFNSGAFNHNDASGYHNKERVMHKLEQACVLIAINNWKDGIQTTKCSDIRRKYNGYCKKCHHFF